MEQPENKRRSPRSKMTQSVRVRPSDGQYPPELCSPTNMSRFGFYFETAAGHYYVGMIVHVTRNFRPGDPMSHEETGDIVRVEKVAPLKWGVAVRVLKPGGRVGD